MAKSTVKIRPWKGMRNRELTTDAELDFWSVDTKNVTSTKPGTCEKRPGYLNLCSADPFTAPVRWWFQIENTLVISDGATIKSTTVSTSY